MSELSGSKSPALHDVAPYPGPNGVPVTARTMGAHYAAFALMHHTLACDLLDTKDREGIRWSTNLSILSYGIAHLLRSMTEIEGLGDQAALELWQDQHHPGSLGPDLRALLADADVDPEAVVKVAEEVARRHREKSAPVAPSIGGDVAKEIHAAVIRLRCEHSFPVYLAGDSFASPDPCSACGALKGDLIPVADHLKEPLAALLDEAANEVQAVLAEEHTLGPDDTYDMAVLDHRHEVRADLTHALAVARAVLGTSPTP